MTGKSIACEPRLRRRALLAAAAMMVGVAYGQAPSIATVSPSSATQGDGATTVTSTLSGQVPPGDVTPTSYTIGSISGASVSWNGTDISGSFDIAADATVGALDVVVVFPAPPGQGGSLTITRTDGFTIASSSGPARIYVDADSSAGTPDGESWATAYADLQAALAAAASGDEVWVAEGTYKPTTGSDRSIAFELPAGVAVYGGFAGDENTLGDRDVSGHPTVLSGDIGAAGVATDNSYHVVLGTDGVTLDGFTVRDGYASGERLLRMGGGMYADVLTSTIANCTFTANHAEVGGGLYLINTDAGNEGYDDSTYDVAINGCTFSSNDANYGGGMLARVGADATLSGCVFSSNTGVWRGGALFIDYGADITLTGSCSFTGNSTSGNGGAIYIDDRSSQLGGTVVTISSSSFTSNTATYRGGAIGAYNSATDVSVSNCSFTSNIAGTGGGAIAVDQGVSLTVSANTYSSNSGGTGTDDVDADGDSTVTEARR